MGVFHVREGGTRTLLHQPTLTPSSETTGLCPRFGQLTANLMDGKGPGSPHVRVAAVGRRRSLFPILTALPARSSLFLPRCPTQAGVFAAFDNCRLEEEALHPSNEGHFRQPLPSPEPCLGPWDPATYPRGIRLFRERRQGCLGRGRREDGRRLTSSRRSCGSSAEVSLCPGSQRRTGEPLQAPPIANSSPYSSAASLPPSGPPSSAGIVFVAAAAPKKF